MTASTLSSSTEIRRQDVILHADTLLVRSPTHLLHSRYHQGQQPAVFLYNMLCTKVEMLDHLLHAHAIPKGLNTEFHTGAIKSDKLKRLGKLLDEFAHEDIAICTVESSSSVSSPGNNIKPCDLLQTVVSNPYANIRPPVALWQDKLVVSQCMQ